MDRHSGGQISWLTDYRVELRCQHQIWAAGKVHRDRNPRDRAWKLRAMIRSLHKQNQCQCFTDVLRRYVEPFESTEVANA